MTTATHHRHRKRRSGEGAIDALDEPQPPSSSDIAHTLKNPHLSKSEKLSMIHEFHSKAQPSKNLAHVPCKFFRQGACQAGDACPFSHATDAEAEATPCQYFLKGNCKFGMKCALAHVLPDGTVLNPKRGFRRRRRRSSNRRDETRHLKLETDEITEDVGVPDKEKTVPVSIPLAIPSAPSSFLQSSSYLHSVPSRHSASESTTSSSVTSGPFTSSSFVLHSPSQSQSFSSLNFATPTDIFASSPVHKAGSIWSPTGSPTSSHQTTLAASTASLRSLSGPSQGRPVGWNTSKRRASSSTLLPLFAERKSVWADISESAIADDEEPLDSPFGGLTLHENPLTPALPHRLSFNEPISGLSSSDHSEPSDHVLTDSSDVDLLPDSLLDLLTPKELLRRNSRTTEQPKLFSDTYRAWQRPSSRA